MGKDAKIDRTVENATIEFMSGLKKDMSPEKVMSAYKQLVTDHAIIESKLMVMRAAFFNVLQQELAKEQEEQMESQSRSPLAQALNHLH